MKNVLTCLLLVSLALSLGCSPKSTVQPSPKPVANAGMEPEPNMDPSRDPRMAEDPRIPRMEMPRIQAIQEEVAIPVEEYVATEQLDSPPAAYRFLSWNVESEGADADVIAKQLAELNPNDHYDVFTLSEVMAGDFEKFRSALGEHYKYVFTKSGNNDRLQIIYNKDKFDLVRKFEIEEINIKNRYRAPLVAHLKDRKTGVELMVMVNHLARGKAEIREQQATMLVEWARNETMPIFALGDYNFDYVFETRKGNPGFVNMMRDNIWRWVEPAELIDTNWYDNPREPDGKDDYPGSILDFAFVAGPAKDWTSVCNVIVRENDFPDDETTSDHRPFELLISK